MHLDVKMLKEKREFCTLDNSCHHFSSASPTHGTDSFLKKRAKIYYIWFRHYICLLLIFGLKTKRWVHMSEMSSIQSQSRNCFEYNEYLEIIGFSLGKLFRDS